jgi:hypothetical protein
MTCPQADAAIHPIRHHEIHLPVATARAVLRCMRGIHSDGAPGGPCCLPGDHCRKLAPRGVMDAPGEAAVLDHTRDAQIVKRDDITGVDEAAGLLMRKVLALPPRSLPPARRPRLARPLRPQHRRSRSDAQHDPRRRQDDALSRPRTVQRPLSVPGGPAIGAYLAECAASQARLADYDALVQAVRAQRTPAAEERL